jgi:transposase
MKKNTTAKKSSKGTLGKQGKREIRALSCKQKLTVGLDLGDRSTHYCIVDETGTVVSEGALPTTKTGLESLFGKMAPSRVALEVGTHSPWVSRQLAGLGHEAIVANAHQVKSITESVRKNDRRDARQLAWLARVDPRLLSPIRHRGEQAQMDLAMIRARADLMEARTRLVNSARGLVKPMGERLAQCDADQAGQKLAEGLKEEVRLVVEPLLKIVEEISGQIEEYDQKIAAIAQRYPEEELLRQVYGVGRLIALTYVLTLEDGERFTHSRDVGPYLGLTRQKRDSGEREPELGISKAGDGLLRSLLVQGAHCILRKGAPESDLREWGLGKAGKGGKRAKKRAVVAVARKLAVLLHHLWVTGEVYDPHHNRKAAEAAAEKRKSAAKSEAAA